MIGIILCLSILLSIFSSNWSQISAASNASFSHEMWVSDALQEPLLISQRLRQRFASKMASWARTVPLAEIVILLPRRICALSYDSVFFIRWRCHILALIEIVLKTVLLQIRKWNHYVFLVGTVHILPIPSATKLAALRLMIIHGSGDLVRGWQILNWLVVSQADAACICSS